MPTPQVHCNLDERAFSWTVFFTRFIAGGVLMYISVGCLLYYREFLYNAAVMGLPMPVQLAVGGLVVQLILALLLLLGWFTRWAAAGAVLATAFTAIVFFASNFNKLYVALLLLLIAALLPALLLGPGRLSVDFNRARRRVEQQFRGL